MIKRISKWLLIVVVPLVMIGAFGPKPDFPPYDLDPITLDLPIEELDNYIAEKESKILDLKEDNEARVVWHSEVAEKTEYALVYLHGFSASQEEGDPVHSEFAKRYGMNMYLARLADHGRADEDSFKELTPSALLNSAKEAIAIGALLGEKVIVMSCSTGSTYSIMLAPHDSRVEALLMYSPNIGIKDPSAALVTYPWGKQLLELVMGGEVHHINYPLKARQYWNDAYHIDGIIAMQSLIDEGMNVEIFEDLDIPVYIGCYYKDIDHQDEIVSVERMEWFYDNISTIAENKRMVRFPEAGRHVFTSHIMKEEFSSVISSSNLFAEEVLGLVKYSPSSPVEL